MVIYHKRGSMLLTHREVHKAFTTREVECLKKGGTVTKVLRLSSALIVLGGSKRQYWGAKHYDTHRSA